MTQHDDKTTFEAQMMKKLNNTEVKLKRLLLIKKCVIH